MDKGDERPQEVISKWSNRKSGLNGVCGIGRRKGGPEELGVYRRVGEATREERSGAQEVAEPVIDEGPGRAIGVPGEQARENRNCNEHCAT
jgi:hypothetical protein